jgi:peptidyl-dipeptidase Dcp
MAWKVDKMSQDSPLFATQEQPVTSSNHATHPSGPLVSPWSGPFGGVPPWDQVVPEAFPEAFEIAMADQREAIGRIVADPAPPTFENTLAALERSGRALTRVRTLFEVHASSLKVGIIPALEAELMPKLAGFHDEIVQNGALFRRIETVYQGRAEAGLTPEQQRLAWLVYTEFVRAGASLDPAGKARIQEINQQLAGLFTRFNQNVLADENRVHTVVEHEADLAGLAPAFRAAAARAAEDRGLPGRWVIANTRSAVEPFLSYAEHRGLREQVWRAFISRGDLGGETDNKAVIRDILRLRYERARLLGYATHAHWALELAMAGSPERAVALLEAVWRPAAAQVRADVAELQAIADQEGGHFPIEPWDYRFYAEKLRKAKYALDLQEVEPYLQLDLLREGMFWAAGELYGLAFAPVQGLPLQHPDVRVWSVADAGGRPVGLFYLDPFAREGKGSGAWMNNYRDQEGFDAPVLPIVSNNDNFLPGGPGEPVLVSWDDAVTLFHEFGHALHGLLSAVRYPSLAGTAVARDFVEFPSQLNEHWLHVPELLRRFARHHRTGEPIPDALVDKLTAAARFNQGFSTLEYLASAVLDMKFHLAGGQDIDPAAFEAEELARLGMPSAMVMRHRPPHFNHIFSGDDYAAGYYAYLWADALTADAWEAFQEGQGPWDKAVAGRLLRTVLSVGNTVDPAEAFRAFRGRDVAVDALMRKRGFLAS